ncbi:MAG: ABC transporter permease [Candidatus Thorarchaeota archaeon]|jgi:ABC-2 type transport system permease protein
MTYSELYETEDTEIELNNERHFYRTSFLIVVSETIKKQLTLRFRYKANMVGEAFGVILQVAIFAAMAGAVTLVGVNNLEGNNVFIFFLASLVLIVFSTVALSAPLNAVVQDLHNGTLEYLFSTPISRYAYFIGTAIAEAISKSIFFVPMLVVLILFSGVTMYSGFLILAVCITVIVGLIAFGVLVALMGVMWKQVSAIAALLFTFFEFICGAYFPVTSMPIIFQVVAFALPHTWGYDLIRYYSFQGSWTPIMPIHLGWMMLVLYALLYIVISSKLLKVVERRAKKFGLHLI